jgi:hypothetical protein
MKQHIPFSIQWGRLIWWACILLILLWALA